MTDMFKCSNCGQEKSTDERASIGWLANIGFILTMRSPWWPEEVCKTCRKQVRWFGIIALIIVALFGAIFTLGKLVP